MGCCNFHHNWLCFFLLGSLAGVQCSLFLFLILFRYFNHYLDLGYLGPTEAECFVIVLYWVTWILGIVIALNTLLNFSRTCLLGHPCNNFWYHFTSKQNYLVLSSLALCYSSCDEVCLVTIHVLNNYSFCTGLSLANKNGIRTFTALSQLIPFTLSYISYTAMIVFSPELYEAHPHMVLITANVLFSYLTVTAMMILLN